jgi:hypothetical protein
MGVWYPTTTYTYDDADRLTDIETTQDATTTRGTAWRCCGK